DSMIRLWHLGTGKQVQQFRAPHDRCNSVLFSPDGRTVVAHTLDGTSRLWEVATGKQVETWKREEKPIGFSAEGRPLELLASDGAAELVDGPTGKERRSWRVPPGKVNTAALSPDHKTLAVVIYARPPDSGYRLYVYDAATGKELRAHKALGGPADH